MVQANTREISARLEREALAAIASVGWLTTMQIGVWVWPEMLSELAQNRAQKLMSRLCEKGDTLMRKTPLGANAFVLTRPGARRCTAEGLVDVCVAGYKLSQLDGTRQALAVEWMREQRKCGRTVIGANSIRAGAVDGHIGSDVRGADALMLDSDTARWTAAVVIRTESAGLVRKVQRVRAAVDELVFLGEPRTIARFKKALVESDKAMKKAEA